MGSLVIVILFTFLALRGQQGISIGPITDADHGHGSVELGYDVRVCSCRVGGQTVQRYCEFQIKFEILRWSHLTNHNPSLCPRRFYLQLGSFLPTSGEIRVTNGMAVSITSSAINENVNASCSAVDITNKVRDKDSLKYIIIFRINVIRLYRGRISSLSFPSISKNEQKNELFSRFLLHQLIKLLYSFNMYF